MSVIHAFPKTMNCSLFCETKKRWRTKLFSCSAHLYDPNYIIHIVYESAIIQKYRLIVAVCRNNLPEKSYNVINVKIISFMFEKERFTIPLIFRLMTFFLFTTHITYWIRWSCSLEYAIKRSIYFIYSFCVKSTFAGTAHKNRYQRYKLHVLP